MLVPLNISVETTETSNDFREVTKFEEMETDSDGDRLESVLL